MDGLTMKTLGYAEAEVWHGCFGAATCDRTLTTLVEAALPSGVSSLLATMRDELCDPFDKQCDTTMRFTTLFGYAYYAAKLDWLFFDRRSFHLLGCGVGPEGLSDHQCVFVELQLQ
jgi:hypothetical protein